MLAGVTGITLQAGADGYTLAAAAIDNGARGVLLSTATLQALGGAFLAAIA